jgi:hypothetical protein
VTSGIGAVIAFAAFVLIGLPFHIAAKRYFRVGWNAYVTAGFIVGLLITGLLAVFVGLFLGVWVALASVFWGCTIGATTGYFFWLIRRPDRDEPPTQASPTP